MIKTIKVFLPITLRLKLNRYYDNIIYIFNHLKKYSKNIWIELKIIFLHVKMIFLPIHLPKKDEAVLVNLGCGKTNHPKFINIDGFPYSHVDFVHRIDLLPIFPDESVDLIYASHCLEHFKYRDINRVLNEWKRVLKPGGILRLSVPDFDKLIKIYNDTNNPDDIVEQIMGGQNSRYNFHYVLLNRCNLSKYLTNSGFVNVCEWIPGSDQLKTFDDFSIYLKEVNGKKYEISLNLEAQKEYAK